MNSPTHTAKSIASASLTEVADDIYAYIQPPGGWCLSNAGVIRGTRGVLVVDTLATERRGRDLLESIGTLRPGPGRTVVNTHHHGDHTFGNHLFGPQTVVVAHEWARTEMADAGLALTRLWPDVEWGDVRVTLPSLTFRDSLTIYVDDRRVELIHVGPAHTTNDVVAWLPAERVLFAGDVALAGCTPFVLMGSVRGSLNALDRLRRLGARIVVGGHGPIAGEEIFDETTAYLTYIQDLASQGHASGLTPLELARQADLGPFDGLLDPERTVGNLHRAYAELAVGHLGRPLDVASVFDEMVQFNGGRLPKCLA